MKDTVNYCVFGLMVNEVQRLGETITNCQSKGPFSQYIRAVRDKLAGVNRVSPIERPDSAAYPCIAIRTMC